MIYVLSAKRIDSMRWARSQGVPITRIRHVQSSSTLPGVINPKTTRIVKLPSYAKHFARFAINQRLGNITRRAKIEVEEWRVNETGDYYRFVGDDTPEQENFQVVPQIPTADLLKMAEEQGAEIDLPYNEGGTLPPGPTEVTSGSVTVEQIVDNQNFLAKVSKTQSEVAKLHQANVIENLDEAWSDLNDDVRPASYSEGEGEQASVAGGLSLPAAEKRDAEITEVQDVVEQTRDDLSDVADQLVELTEVKETEKVAQIEAIAATDELGSDEPAEKPKRVRRNKQQIAYDEARAALDKKPTDLGLITKLSQAREKLADRDPSDPRLRDDSDDLDF